MNRFAPVGLLSYELLGAAEAQDKQFPPVPLAKHNASFGAHVQRTMKLLASSTAEKHNTVRILF